MKKLKILISAYACEPKKGSEPGVGWNLAKQASRFHEVWVITRANNKEAIENELMSESQLNLNFVYVDLPAWLSFWKKGKRGLYLYYSLWQIWAYQRAKHMHRYIHFDLSHHITFGSYSLPTFIPFLNIPFIWGPIGGVDTVPSSLITSLGFKGALFEFMRNSLHYCRFKFDPFMLVTLQRSGLIICKTKQMFCFLRKFKNRERMAIMLETGLSSVPSTEIIVNKSCSLIFSAGRLIPSKGFILAIEAFEIACRVNEHLILEIAGEGCDLERLVKFAEDKSVLKKIRFLHQLPRKDLFQKMNNCDIFLFTSLREAGSWVIMEAMAFGKPVICFDYSGMGEMVTEDCGYKIKPTTREETVKNLAKSILQLAKDQNLREQMGKAARKRALEEFNWDKKGDYINSLYLNLVNQTVKKMNDPLKIQQ